MRLPVNLCEEHQHKTLRNTYAVLGLNVLVCSFRIRHILQHNFAHLQRRFAKSDLQDFDISTLKSILLNCC